MAKKIKKKAALKTKKKVWVKIQAPRYLNNRIVGETLIENPVDTIGKNMRINLSTITGDMKQQNVYIILTITESKGETAFSNVSKYNIAPSAISRFIRRGKGRVDDSFTVFTADQKKITIKPFLVTINKTSKSVKTGLRLRARKVLAARIAKAKYDDLMREIIVHKFQRSIMDDLKKIYPLRVCELRSISIEKSEKKIPLKVEKIEEAIKKIEAKVDIKDQGYLGSHENQRFSGHQKSSISAGLRNSKKSQRETQERKPIRPSTPKPEVRRPAPIRK